MKHSGTVITVAAVFFLSVIAFFVLTLSGRSVGLTKQQINQKLEIWSKDGLKQAGQELSAVIDKQARRCAAEEYNSLLRSLGSSSAIDEEEAIRMFAANYCNALQEAYGSGEVLCSRLQEALPKIDTGELTVDTEHPPQFSILTDEETNIDSQCVVSGITVLYSYGESYWKECTYEFVIRVPNTHFFHGNDELFEYSLIGNKGIYVTGKTSSMVGNVYAGAHPAAESRKAEAIYGEKEVYGGLNILSTQLGVQADKIVSEGDINLRGAFAVFGNEELPISIYANQINEMNGYPIRTDYYIEGTEVLRVDIEEDDSEYERIRTMIINAGRKLYTLEYYYDSDNDEDYSGTYRKVIAGTDVTITDDVTGIVITSGNVIVDAGCNVEGMIFAGDRIYIQGNNNIVSNREVLRTMLSEEQKAVPEVSEEISHNLSDYLYGLQSPGLYDTNFNYVEMLQKN